MFDQAQNLLKSYFGYSTFRHGQEQAIQSVLEGHSTLTVMPTGGGKSICYQIPALLFEGTTLVVSPLISLMKDQVDTLVQLGIKATYINSSLTLTETRERLASYKKGDYKLLYVAPERLESHEFLDAIREMTIPLIAVDEAHCISQWGHDFRPSYLNIQHVIQTLPEKPRLLALTATATPKVREDICHALSIDEANTVITGFERENLSFSTIKGQDRITFIKNYIKKNPHESGIIYAATRKTVDQLNDRLKKENVSVARYHAGMSDVERAQEQERFLQDDVTVMVATSAFGMGIDKSNIRYVIHYQLPKNMESYYQEAGRAGRDGLPSECILLYSSQDVQIQRFLIDQSTDVSRQTQELEKLQFMVDYCHTEACLQAYILSYFGEVETERCERCGNCTDSRTSIDVTEDTQMVLSCVIRMGQRFGKTVVAQVLTGSRNKKILELKFDQLSTYGIMRERSTKDVSDFIEFLISQDILMVAHGAYPTIYVSPTGKDVLKGKQKITRKEAVVIKQATHDDPLFEHLRALRKDKASQESVPPFVIFSDMTLRDMCLKLPQNDSEFLEVSGVGENKLKKYGDAFLQAISHFISEHPDRERETQFIEKPVKAAKKKAVKDSHLETLKLYNEKEMSIPDIATERDLSERTIENHLIQCAEEGLSVHLLDFIPDEFQSMIEEAIGEVGDNKLKPIKEALPNDVTYFMIKAYLTYKRMTAAVTN